MDRYFDLIRKDSERVMNNTFMFQNPWDMECTDFPISFESSIDWNYNPKGDPEWTFMLARHGFIPNLAKAEVYFNNSMYGDKAIQLIHDFIVNAPLTDETRSTSWRSLDSAIRVVNWIDSLSLLSSFRGEEVVDAEIVEGIRKHVEYLKGFDNTFLRLSNWGAIGNSGLYKTSHFLSDEEGIEIGRRLFLQSITNQILPDGFQWEQSSMYQAEVLLHTLDFILTARKYGDDIDSRILDAASGMAHSFMDMMKPDNRQFMQSDSDSTELLDIIGKAAFVLSDGMLKWASGNILDRDYALFATEEEKKAFEEITPIMPEYFSAAHEESGNVYLRSNWGSDGSVVHFKCGSHGGGHGHGDILHVDASLEGVDILVDSGRYTYVDCPMRKLLKLPSRHNTILLDDEEVFEPVDSWGYGRSTRGILYTSVFRKDWSLTEGTHLGYIAKGLLPVRKVLLIDDLLILIDRFEGSGTHKMTRPFLFNEKGLLKENGNHYSYGDFNVFFNSGKVTKDEREISFHYNTLDYTDCLVLEDVLRSDDLRYMVIGKGIEKVSVLPVKVNGQDRILPSSYAQNIHIETEGDDIDIITILNNSINGVFLLESGNITDAYGSLVVQRGSRKEIFRI